MEQIFEWPIKESGKSELHQTSGGIDLQTGVPTSDSCLVKLGHQSAPSQANEKAEESETWLDWQQTTNIIDLDTGKREIQEIEETVAIQQVAKHTVIMERKDSVEKIEITIASTVATIEDEIEPVTKPIKMVKHNPTKQKAKKREARGFRNRKLEAQTRT